jgi:hypothetical protein
MGDIDVDNFSEEVIGRIRSDLASAAFVAIDLEMTGISFPNKSENSGDTIGLRYSKVRDIVNAFGIIQVGLAVFQPDNACAVYNFYVFPRPVTEGPSVDAIPLVSLCSASTNFNRSHGMDFGRWISKGVTYVDGNLEQALRRTLLEDPEAGSKAWERCLSSSSSALDEATKITPEYISQEQKILSDIASWLDGKTGSTAFKVPFVHGGQKWLKSILSRVHDEYPQLRLVEEVSGGGSARILTTKTESEIFNDYVGFRRVWTAISESGKPVVFHNGFLDLAFCYQAFEGDLPESLSEFKQRVQTLFRGGLFDTRLIALESGLSMAGSAALETLVDLFASQTPVVVRNSGKYNTDGSDFGKFHEAGYDALLTGKVFLGLEQRLNKQVTEWKNCLCVSRCLWCLSIDQLDSDRLLMDCGPGKSRLVRILSDLQPKCSTRDILNHFEDLKSIVSSAVANITWINDNSGILLITYSPPGDRSSDSVTSALSARIMELVKLGGVIGDAVRLSTTAEYAKSQIEQTSHVEKKFRLYQKTIRV